MADLNLTNLQKASVIVSLTKNGAADTTSTVQAFGANAAVSVVPVGSDNRTFAIVGNAAGSATITFVGPGGTSQAIPVTVAQTPDQFAMTLIIGTPEPK